VLASLLPGASDIQPLLEALVDVPGAWYVHVQEVRLPLRGEGQVLSSMLLVTQSAASSTYLEKITENQIKNHKNIKIKYKIIKILKINKQLIIYYYYLFLIN
jgi:hypothetical protein